MQTLKNESSKKERQYEARIQEVEARLRQETEVRPLGDDHPGQRLDGDMELITPELAAELSSVASKQKAKSVEHSEGRCDIQSNPGRHTRRVVFQNEAPERPTPDVEMDSDSDRRNAGTAWQEPLSPRPVVGFQWSNFLIVIDKLSSRQEFQGR